MIRTATLVTLSALAVALAGSDRTPASARANAAPPAATSLGEPVTCIPLRDIDNLRYYDDYTIDFEMKNRTVYRNTLPNRCPELGFEQRIAYKTSLSQLCNTDVFTVLHSDGTRGATCGFGKFTPVRLASAKRR
ncbi:MAG TPA: DUF6491 family protein [Sphingomonadaceae bacterium]